MRNNPHEKTALIIWINYLLFVWGVLFSLGCNPSSDKSTFYKKNITNKVEQFSDSINTIQIYNPKDYSVKFQLKINNIFPLDFEGILRNINDLSNQNKISPEKASWMFISDNTFHSKPFTEENWQHNPLLFLNSLGGGYCDDRSSALVKLWDKQGDSSRIIRLEGHVVPEVSVKGKWQMYDPDYKVYYCDENSNPKSVAELESSQDNILTSKCDNLYINPIFYFENPITSYLTKFYKTKENNHDVTQWHLSYKDIPDDFILPAHSMLEMVYNKESNVTNIVVKLNSKSKGIIRIPLVPYQASGKMKLFSNDTVFSISEQNVLLPKNKYYTDIQIVSVSGESEISYLVNPKLSFMKKDNKLEVNSSDDIEIKFINNSNFSNSVLFAKEYLFFDQKTVLHEEFLNQVSEYRGEKIDEHFLKENYLLFLEDDKRISKSEKSDLVHQFEDDYKKVFISLIDEQHKIVIEQYPKSIFYLFLASRYQKTDYLFEILNKQE